MESQPNAGYFPHTDSIQAVIQGFPCFPYPEQTTTAPANDTWEYTQYDRNTGLLIYPPRGGAASEPSFAEDFQIPQVPQSPFLQTRPQPAGPSTTEENRMPIEVRDVVCFCPPIWVFTRTNSQRGSSQRTQRLVGI